MKKKILFQKRKMTRWRKWIINELLLLFFRYKLDEKTIKRNEIIAAKQKRRKMKKNKKHLRKKSKENWPALRSLRFEGPPPECFSCACLKLVLSVRRSDSLVPGEKLSDFTNFAKRKNLSQLREKENKWENQVKLNNKLN